MTADHSPHLAETRPRTERMIGRFGTDEAGPRMIVTGGIHGNEPAGLVAIRRVIDRLERDRPAMTGSVVFLHGNLTAFEQQVRYVDLDLNRQWNTEGMSAAFSEEAIPNRPSEHRELRELARELDGLIRQRDEAIAAAGSAAQQSGSGDDGPEGLRQQLEDSLSGLDLPTMVAGGDAAGTFSAFAAARFGADSVAERTAKAAEKTADNTNRLVQEARHGGLAFG